MCTILSQFYGVMSRERHPASPLDQATVPAGKGSQGIVSIATWMDKPIIEEIDQMLGTDS